ncbi:MAG: hypothetical protein AAFR04_01005 [Pseudomonadota bacterium]
MKLRIKAGIGVVALGVAATIGLPGGLNGVPAAHAAALPAIKMSARNQPPRCVTPGRLMAYLQARNRRLPPRFRAIASHYMRHGRQLGVRWDMAFYQMLVETNFLTFRRGNGQPGDVRASQNNFAGLGATGGGVPGERFRTVSAGVLAHMQHILMYTGTRIRRPVADRTRKVQAWGILNKWRRRLPKPVTFTHLTRKWSPYDRGYSDDIKSLENRFMRNHCRRPDPRPELYAAAKLSPQQRAAQRRARARRIAAQAVRRAKRDDDRARRALGARQQRERALGARQQRERALRARQQRQRALAARQQRERARAARRQQQRVLAQRRAAAQRERQIAAARQRQRTVARPSIQPQASPDGPPVTLVQPRVQPDSKPKRPAASAQKPRDLASSAPAAAKTLIPTPPAAAPTSKCKVYTASYGGQRALIIQVVKAGVTNYTVLDVNKGREQREAAAYIAAYAKGGRSIAAFDSPAAALERAFKLCPEKN